MRKMSKRDLASLHNLLNAYLLTFFMKKIKMVLVFFLI